MHPEFCILDLKALVEDSVGIAVQEQRILFKGRILHDADTLEAAGIACPTLAVAPRGPSQLHA